MVAAEIVLTKKRTKLTVGACLIMKRRPMLNQPRSALIAAGGLFAFLCSTNPHQLPVPLLLVPIILLFCSLFLTSHWLLRKMRIGQDMPIRKAGIIAAALAMGPVVLLALASINQLTIRDSVLSSVFVVGLAWYFLRQPMNADPV